MVRSDRRRTPRPRFDVGPRRGPTRRSPRSDPHLPGRPPCALAMGGQRPVGGGLRALGIRRDAHGSWGPGGRRPGRSMPRRTPHRRSGRLVVGAVRLDAQRRAERGPLGFGGSAGGQLRLPRLWPGRPDRRSSRWSHRSATPILAVLASSRLRHVLIQAELETFALDADGSVAWRIAHSDVVTAAELVGGRLVLTSYSGLLNVLDPATGRQAG